MSDNTCKVCGQEIKIAIFRGSGYCCVDHKKEAGIDHVPYGDMMLVTKEEAALVNDRRRRQADLHMSDSRNGGPKGSSSNGTYR